MSELLSIHYDRADQPAKSWRYSRVAGERAQRNGASVEAAAFYQRALEAARDLDEITLGDQADVAERLGDTWEFGGRYERSSAAYRRARKLGAGDPPRQVQLCRKIGYVRDHEGRYDAAQRWFRRGLAELRDVEDEDTARALRGGAHRSRWCRAGSGWVATLAPSRSSAGRSRTPPRAGRAARWRTRTACTTSCSWTRAATRRRSYSDRAAVIYEELGDHRGVALSLNEMGSTAYWLGRWDDAVRCWERAIEADRRSGALVNNAIYLNNIGEVRSDQGRYAEAEVLLREACELWTAGGWRAGTGWALSNLGRLAARDARTDEAKQRLGEACSVLTEIGAEALLVETQARELERCVLAGAHEDALALVDDVGARAERCCS